MSAVEETGKSIDAALAAAQAEQQTPGCGGPMLDATVACLLAAQTMFAWHAEQEDRPAPAG